MKWTRLKQKGQVPLARSSHSITVVEGACYIFGGEHEPRTPIDSVVSKFDLEKGQWTHFSCGGDAPTPRVGYSAAVVGQSLYIFGGRSGIEMGEGFTNELHRLDLSSRKWSQVATTGHLPEPRSFHAMVSVKVKLYVFGGCGTSGRLSDLHSFDCESASWELLPSSGDIQGRGGAGLVASASGDALFLIGGFAGHELNDVHCFKLATGTWDCPECCTGNARKRWSELPARSMFGVGLHDCSACTHGRHLVLFGGEVNPSDKGHAGAGKFSNDTYCYEPGKVDSESMLPTPRGWFAACAKAQGLLVHGGNSPNNERHSDMYLLDFHSH